MLLPRQKRSCDLAAPFFAESAAALALERRDLVLAGIVVAGIVVATRERLRRCGLALSGGAAGEGDGRMT